MIRGALKIVRKPLYLSILGQNVAKKALKKTLAGIKCGFIDYYGLTD